MKLSAVQYLFAYGIPGKLCYFAFPFFVLFETLKAAEVRAAGLADARMLGHIFVILVTSIPIGLLLGGLFVCFFLSPAYRAMERVNGGPFDKGDRVYVINGPQKGRTVTVYAKGQGLQVRIDLGEEAKMSFKDVYSTLSLVKTKGAEPSHP